MKGRIDDVVFFILFFLFLSSCSFDKKLNVLNKSQPNKYVVAKDEV